MNKDDASQYLPLVQALADGKTIQHFDTANWNDISNPVFISSHDQYRIKPEPREWTGKVIETGQDFVRNKRSFMIQIDGATGELPDLGAIALREIID